MVRGRALAQLINVVDAHDLGGAQTRDLGEIAEDLADRALVLLFGPILGLHALLYTAGSNALTICHFAVCHLLEAVEQPIGL